MVYKTIIPLVVILLFGHIHSIPKRKTLITLNDEDLREKKAEDAAAYPPFIPPLPGKKAGAASNNELALELALIDKKGKQPSKNEIALQDLNEDEVISVGKKAQPDVKEELVDRLLEILKEDTVSGIKREEPPLPGKRETPPLPGKRETPPLPGKRETPPLPGKREEPPLPNKREEPPLPNKRETPPLPNKREEPPLPNKRDEVISVGKKVLQDDNEELVDRLLEILKEDTVSGNKREEPPLPNKRETPTLPNKRDEVISVGKKAQQDANNEQLVDRLFEILKEDNVLGEFDTPPVIPLPRNKIEAIDKEVQQDDNMELIDRLLKYLTKK
uniref:PPLPamide neuropeptide n=1 Tax=Platynereis dumerilii TaxID=6359 RepID=V5TCT2_PLADU|nr:PPLPamide neuropeptide precursor [Platynereis dumerilii]